MLYVENVPLIAKHDHLDWKKKHVRLNSFPFWMMIICQMLCMICHLNFKYVSLLGFNPCQMEAILF
jgi:hypothetical protein